VHKKGHHDYEEDEDADVSQSRGDGIAGALAAQEIHGAVEPRSTLRAENSRVGGRAGGRRRGRGGRSGGQLVGLARCGAEALCEFNVVRVNGEEARGGERMVSSCLIFFIFLRLLSFMSTNKKRQTCFMKTKGRSNHKISTHTDTHTDTH